VRPVRPLARLGAHAATAAALIVAACGDREDATAPSSRPSLAGAGSEPGSGTTTPPGPGPTVAVTLHVGDQAALGGSAGVPGTSVRFDTPGSHSRIVVDNVGSDTDARVGHYRVMMPSATSYAATVRAMPDQFSAAGASATATRLGTRTSVHLGSIVLRRKPGLHVWLLKDGALVPGQAIHVTGPDGWSQAVADGGLTDRDAFGTPGPSDGRINLRLPVTGSYTVCALTRPSPLFEARCQGVVAEHYFFAYSATLTYVPRSFRPTPP
jgi:hypothetical protein